MISHWHILTDLVDIVDVKEIIFTEFLLDLVLDYLKLIVEFFLFLHVFGTPVVLHSSFIVFLLANFELKSNVKVNGVASFVSRQILDDFVDVFVIVVNYALRVSTFVALLDRLIEV